MNSASRSYFESPVCCMKIKPGVLGELLIDSVLGDQFEESTRSDLGNCSRGSFSVSQIRGSQPTVLLKPPSRRLSTAPTCALKKSVRRKCLSMHRRVQYQFSSCSSDFFRTGITHDLKALLLSQSTRFLNIGRQKRPIKHGFCQHRCTSSPSPQNSSSLPRP